MILLSLTLVVPCFAELRRWSYDPVTPAEQGSLNGVVVTPDSTVVLAPVEESENLALGKDAFDDTRQPVPLTDGSIEREVGEWSSRSPDVFGRRFTIDLGVERAIVRIRVLAGETISERPEYFIRGYRLEAASESKPDIYHLIAENSNNLNETIDTSQDHTWLRWDNDGRPIPVVGRFVRFTLTRQDRINWVVIGEIEVYGVGRQPQGELVGMFDAGEPVNVGKLRWDVETPQGTRVTTQFQSSQDGQTWEAWDEQPRYETPDRLFEGEEPTRYLRYRVVLETRSPLVTPALKHLEVEYDRRLVASYVLAAIHPDTVRRGEMASFTYDADMTVGSNDWGIDRLVLGVPIRAVEEVTFTGRLVPPDDQGDVDAGYRILPGQEDQTVIGLSENFRLTESGRLQIRFGTTFFVDHTPVPLSVGNTTQERTDGYVNYQNAIEDPLTGWDVRAIGNPLSLLSNVSVEPRPFSPFDSRPLEVTFTVGNVQQETTFALHIYTLTGRRVRTLKEMGVAGHHRFLWNGNDKENQTVPPGLYLFQLEVEAGVNTTKRSGTIVVAY